MDKREELLTAYTKLEEAAKLLARAGEALLAEEADALAERRPQDCVLSLAHSGTPPVLAAAGLWRVRSFNFYPRGAELRLAVFDLEDVDCALRANKNARKRLNVFSVCL